MRKAKPQYWTLVSTRNGGETIRCTVESIMRQTVPPTSLCVVNDGSTDDTSLILETLKRRYRGRISILPLKDEGYDIRKVVKNINAGIEAVKKTCANAEYMMISGDDCVYPRDYCEYILKQMDMDRNLAVASGDIEGARHPDVAPRGAGRFIRISFLNEIGGRFPPYYGYEGWILQKALQLGYSIQNYPSIRYRHLREMGGQHGFKDWGLAMKCLGYHPLEILYRCVKYVLMDRRVSVRYLKVLWDYFIYSSVAGAKRDPYYRFFDEEVRSYTHDKQKRRMVRMIAQLPETEM